MHSNLEPICLIENNNYVELNKFFKINKLKNILLKYSVFSCKANFTCLTYIRKTKKNNLNEDKFMSTKVYNFIKKFFLIITQMKHLYIVLCSFSMYKKMSLPIGIIDTSLD